MHIHTDKILNAARTFRGIPALLAAVSVMAIVPGHAQSEDTIEGILARAAATDFLPGLEPGHQLKMNEIGAMLAPGSRAALTQCFDRAAHQSNVYKWIAGQHGATQAKRNVALIAAAGQCLVSQKTDAAEADVRFDSFKRVAALVSGGKNAWLDRVVDGLAVEKATLDTTHQAAQLIADRFDENTFMVIENAASTSASHFRVTDLKKFLYFPPPNGPVHLTIPMIDVINIAGACKLEAGILGEMGVRSCADVFVNRQSTYAFGASAPEILKTGGVEAVNRRAKKPGHKKTVIKPDQDTISIVVDEIKHPRYDGVYFQNVRTDRARKKGNDPLRGTDYGTDVAQSWTVGDTESAFSHTGYDGRLILKDSKNGLEQRGVFLAYNVPNYDVTITDEGGEKMWSDKPERAAKVKHHHAAKQISVSMHHAGAHHRGRKIAATENNLG